MKKFKTDMVIIGAGPVGLFASFEAGMLKMKTHIIDVLDFSGGQCTSLYPEKPIYDIPACPIISASGLIEKLEEQIKPFDPVFHFKNKVIELKKNGDQWNVITDKGVEIECKAIIIAAGCGAFGPNRPPLPDIENFEATDSVKYLVQKIDHFRGKDVVIAGGGDSAIDWALSLSKVTKSLKLVHRRAKFRASPNSLEQLKELEKQGKIELVVPYQLKGLKGENGRLEAVKVATLDGKERFLVADVLLPFYGLKMELGPIADWELNLNNNHILVEASTMETNQKGIFAIGDIINYPGKLKLILTGFSEGALACHNAYKYVNPDKALHFEYSTSSQVFDTGC